MTDSTATATSEQTLVEPSEQQPPWWRRGVVYQVYIRSFADGNGDGTGDVNGLRSRLPYLQQLGVDAIWINPWYRSPLADGGYDVADYRDIEPRYGTLDDAEALIAEAHQHGIRILGDLVPNHTSDQHEWFKAAVAAPIGDPLRHRYHIRDGKGPDGSEPPTNWHSVFGGPAWSRLPDGQWYLHLFAPEQPDLNWENPEVVAEFQDILRFWLDRGIDGFRIDVAHGLVKDMTFPDVDDEHVELLASSRRPNHPFWDRDGIHEIIRGWRGVLDGYDGDRMMVAEAWVAPDRLPLYLRGDEYHQSFNFDFLESPWDAKNLRGIVEAALAAAADVGSTPTWVLANHDVMRQTTRYGLPNGTDWRAWPSTGPFDILDPAVGLRRARAATLLFLGLPGSAYLYQGEELGLPEVWDLPTDVLDDPVWERSGHTRRGRDGCRVPVPWGGDGPSFGFGDGEPWLPQPDNWSQLGAANQQGDPTSMLTLYQQVLGLRREWAIADEEVTILDLGADVLAYRRGSGLTCVVNLGAEPCPLAERLGRSDLEVLVASDPDFDGTTLTTDSSVWLR
jgi:alpha-glucosidase